MVRQSKENSEWKREAEKMKKNVHRHSILKHTYLFIHLFVSGRSLAYGLGWPEN